MLQKLIEEEGLTLVCAHREFAVQKRDIRIKEPPVGKKEAHQCEDIQVWQEPENLKRYYLYQSLEAKEL